LIVLARDRSADLAIGRLVGSFGLGIYTIAQEVATIPQQFVAPVNRAVYPGYASQAGSLPALQQSFLNVTSMIWALAIPAGIGIGLVAPVLVPVVLGDNWLAAVPIVAVLAVSGTLMVMEGNVAYLFYALGSPRVTSVLMLGFLAVLLPLLVVLTRNMGAIGAAWAHLATWTLFVPISVAVVLRYLRLTVRVFAAAVWRIIFAAGVMTVVVRTVLASTMSNDWPPSLSLVTAIAAGAVTYVAAVFSLWQLAGRPAGVERLALAFTAARLAALRGAKPAPAIPPE
jgi:O-antigen/teichoic acid export membrane protein